MALNGNQFLDIISFIERQKMITTETFRNINVLSLEIHNNEEYRQSGSGTEPK